MIGLYIKVRRQRFKKELAKEGVDAIFFGVVEHVVDLLRRVVVEHFFVACGALVRKAGEGVAADAEPGDLGGADFGFPGDGGGDHDGDCQRDARTIGHIAQ